MIKKVDFFTRLGKLTAKALPLIDPAIKAAYYPSEIKDYPKIQLSEAGFSSLSHYPSRIEVSQFFYPVAAKKPVIDLNEDKNYQWLLNDLRNTPEFVKYFTLPTANSTAFDYHTADFIITFIECYYYLFGTKFSSAKLKKLYQPAERYLFAENISFDIAVPILFLKFENDYFKITDSIHIRKISDENNRARSKVSSYSPAIVSSLFMSATHELVLTGYHLKRQETMYHYFHFSSPDIYPLTIFETFFTILKLVTDETSGFAQILVYPQDWSELSFADLKYVTGTSTKSYPQYFEDFYWNRKNYPVVTSSQLREVKSLFNKSKKLADNKIEIALKRFYKAMMRREEEDIIIDLIIALELLLSDNEKNDISYKLAMRISALICKYNKKKYKPIEVYENVKKIYGFRSAVVHGQHKKLNQTREIKLAVDKSVPAIELAKEYLREVLKIVISEPKHLDFKVNDNLLLK